MLKKVLILLFALVLILLAPTAVFWVQWMMPGNGFPEHIDTQVSARGSAEPDLAAQLERLLVEQRRQSATPSLSAAVAREGELLWAGAVGYASIESETPANPSTLYRLGSTSKPLTGSLLGRLLDADDLTLDATVAKYAPELPEHLHPITVSQLASHTAGVRHYSRSLTWLPTDHESITSHHYDSVEAGLSLFLDDPLLFSPGSSFEYTTFGYSLLALLMERASGVDFGALLDAHLNVPLGVDVRLDDPGIEMTDRAATYTTAKGRWGPAYPANPSYKWAGGGLVATPSDLVRIGQALLGEDFIQPQTRDRLWTPVALPGSDTNPQHYGLGWRIDASIRTLGEARPVQLIHHGGTQMGGVAFWALYPELGVSVAVVANTGERIVRGDVQDLAYALVRAVMLGEEDGI